LLARGDNERLKSESLVALSEEKQKQILHFVQDDATARKGFGLLREQEIRGKGAASGGRCAAGFYITA
jgi:hypothetical protein